MTRRSTPPTPCRALPSSRSLDAIVDECCERRLADAEMLEHDPLVEAFEQALPAAEDDRRHDDRELLDLAGGQRLPDHVGPAHDVYDLVAGGLPCPRDGLVDRADEAELVAGRVLLRPVGHDVSRQ